MKTSLIFKLSIAVRRVMDLISKTSRAPVMSSNNLGSEEEEDAAYKIRWNTHVFVSQLETVVSSKIVSLFFKTQKRAETAI